MQKSLSSLNENSTAVGIAPIQRFNTQISKGLDDFNSDTLPSSFLSSQPEPARGKPCQLSNAPPLVSDPTLSDLGNVIIRRNMVLEIQNSVAKTVSQIKEESKWCVYCRYKLKIQIRHTNGELFYCPEQRKARLCLSCIHPDHSRSTCPNRKVSGICMNCHLPAHASNVTIHSSFDDYGSHCSLGLKDFLRPVCWLVFRDPQTKKILQKFFGFADTEKNYNEWLMNIQEKTGLPNYTRVFQWIIENKLI